MNLIVGATGILGSEICRQLAAEDAPTRALVREASNPDKVAALKALGVELATGDLKDPLSLKAACAGVRTIISTASSTLSRQEGDSIESVDCKGQLDLIAAAEEAGVEHFVLISFPNVDVDFPLQRAKRDVEDRLRRSRMTHTILQPTFFMEVWLSPALGFDVANAAAQIYGDGSSKISWISFQDVATFAVAAVRTQPSNLAIKLGGPEALSPLEVVQLAGAMTGRSIAVQHVGEDALRARHSAATDSLQQSFAGLMLYYAHGDVIDMTDATRIFGTRQLKSVREHLQSAVGSAAV